MLFPRGPAVGTFVRVATCVGCHRGRVLQHRTLELRYTVSQTIGFEISKNGVCIADSWLCYHLDGFPAGDCFLSCSRLLLQVGRALLEDR